MSGFVWLFHQAISKMHFLNLDNNNGSFIYFAKFA